MKPGWTTVTLGEVVKMDRVGVQPADIPEQTPYLGLENIESGGEIKNYQIIGPSSVASVKYTFTPRHLLYGKLRPYLRKIAIPDRSGVCSTDIIPILPSSKLDISFLRHYLDQPSNIALINSLTTGANLPRISPAQLRSIQIPLPPIEEQRRIAAILDRTHAIRAVASKQLRELEPAGSALFTSEFLTSPASADYPLVTLNEISKRTGEYGANLSAIDYSPDKPRYVRITDIDESGRLTSHAKSPAGCTKDWEKYQLHDMDLLLARSGSVGKSYLYRESDKLCIFAGYLIRYQLREDLVIPEYVFGFTKTSNYWAWVKGHQNVVTQPNINAKQYGEDLLMPLPPLARQKKYAHHMKFMEDLRTKLLSQQTHLDALFASLQARAFAGEL